MKIRNSTFDRKTVSLYSNNRMYLGTVSFSTKILSLDPLNPSKDEIAEAVEWILKGEVVAFPTETVYGLGADATNNHAVKRIYEVKNRPADNPLIAHFSSIDTILDFTTGIPDIGYKLADVFWPGPLTMVLEGNKKISSLVTQGLNTLAVRIPAHQVALSLIEQTEVPIAAPSANLSGRPSPTQASHVFTDLSSRIPLILDGGSTSVGIESTVINLSEEQPILLRPGGVTIEELQQVIPDLVIPEISEVQQPLSPGMKYRHYAPDTELILVSNAPDLNEEEIDTLAKSQRGKSLILCTDKKHNHIHNHVLVGDTLKQVQVNFFTSLRLLDQGDYDIGLFEAVLPSKEGYAIMNRVKKASHREI